jgi:hypothetical protein
MRVLHTPAHLGELYNELVALLASEPDQGLKRRDLSRLTERYSHDSVTWMLRVIADDQREAAASGQKKGTR